MVTVRDNGPLAVHDPVESARHPHLEAFHCPPEGYGIGRLDDAVHVVALHGEVDQAEAESFAPSRKRALESAKAPMRAEVPDFRPDPHGDVERAATKLPSRAVRHVLARRLAFAASATARASPAG